MVSAKPSASAQTKAAALSASDRTTVLKALEEGRKKSRAKDFAGALSAFDRALALAPDDARVLSEVGWAALNAGDLTRADAANRRALANVKEKTLRAQVLYNAGRVAEAKKDSEAARKAYAESLALRDNAEVKKRLDGVSGSGAPAAPSCDAGAPSIEALCKCLLGLPETPMVISDQNPVCSARPRSLSLGSLRLSIVRYGAPEDDTGERVNLLVAEDGGVFRPVAELGRDYMPGAFGVHNTATVLGGEAHRVGSRSVIVIKSELRNHDQNMAGLEVCSESVDLETVCALGEGKKPTRCVNVPVVMTSGCGPGFEPAPNELDAETKEAIDNLKKGWGTVTIKLAWSIADDGTLTIKVVEAPPSSAKPSGVGTHTLF
jgi:hypothetical protein